MNLTTSSLNGNFGIKIDDVTPSDLTEPAFQSWAYELWLTHGGLLAIRGAALANFLPINLSPGRKFLAPSNNACRRLERTKRAWLSILRIGNIRNERGELAAQFSDVPP